MKCSKFLEELTDFLDNSNLDPALRADLEEHLQWCHNCYVVYNTTQMTIQIYRDHDVYELPDELRVRLHSAIMSKCKSAKPKGERQA